MEIAEALDRIRRHRDQRYLTIENADGARTGEAIHHRAGTYVGRSINLINGMSPAARVSRKALVETQAYRTIDLVIPGVEARYRIQALEDQTVRVCRLRVLENYPEALVIRTPAGTPMVVAIGPSLYFLFDLSRVQNAGDVLLYIYQLIFGPVNRPIQGFQVPRESVQDFWVARITENQLRAVTEFEEDEWDPREGENVTWSYRPSSEFMVPTSSLTQDEFLKEVSNRKTVDIERNLQRKESEMESLEGQKQTLLRQIQEVCGKMREIESYVTVTRFALNNGLQLQTISEEEKEGLMMVLNSFYEKVWVRTNKLYALTKDIEMWHYLDRDHTQRVRVRAGKFVVCISSDRIDYRREDARVASGRQVAPHHNGSSVCWGANHTDLHTALAQGDFIQVLMMVHQHLTNVNPDSVHIQLLRYSAELFLRDVINESAGETEWPSVIRERRRQERLQRAAAAREAQQVTQETVQENPVTPETQTVDAGNVGVQETEVSLEEISAILGGFSIPAVEESMTLQEPSIPH